MDQRDRDSEYDRINNFLQSAMNQITDDGCGDVSFYLRNQLYNLQSVIHHAYLTHARILEYQAEQTEALSIRYPEPESRAPWMVAPIGSTPIGPTPTATEVRFGPGTVLSIQLHRDREGLPWIDERTHLSFCSEGIHSLLGQHGSDPAYPRRGVLRIARGLHEWGRSYYRVLGFNYRVKNTHDQFFDSEPIHSQLTDLGVQPGEWYTVSFSEIL